MAKTIACNITHQFDGVDISNEDLEHLLAILKWEKVPPFKQPGRTAWYELKEEASVRTLPNQVLKAAKIKGIGFWNPKPEGKIHSGVLAKLNSEEPRPPSTEALTSMLTFPHIGFDKNGEYIIAYSKAAPIGGILHERALLEYESAKILIEKGVPSMIPFMVVSYEGEYEFEGKPMGVVINLSPEADTVRLSIFQYGQAVHHGQCAIADAYFDKICTSLGITGQRHLETTRLQVMNLLSRKIGKLLHGFSAAGLYRYSSEWSNFEYNFGTKEVFLTDLDSTLKLKDVPVEMRSLQVLRDFGTAAYRLIAKFGFPTILNEYTLDNLLTYDPLAELLTGYFPNAPFNQIEPISQHLWNAFIPHWFLLKKHEADINGDWSRPRRQTYKMDHDLFYILTITQVFPLFLQSDLLEKYPTDLTMEDMLQKAKNFLGDRYEYFLYLLNGNKVVHQSKEKGYELSRMGETGEGVIAKQAYESGQVIMRGEIIKIFGGNHSHAAQIAENTWALHAGITHKINHSCSPNAGFRVNETGGHDIVAIKSIQPEEEIVADYAMRNYQIEHFPCECKCGAADCRVKITGWKDLPEHKKEQYRNWSIPYLFELDKKYHLETI